MIELLITSSLLILGICLLRALLKGRISPQLQYGMWLIVAFRLVIPWFYPLNHWFQKAESRFSVMNAAENLRTMVSAQPGVEPLLNNLASGQVTKYPDPETIIGKAAGVDWQLLILAVWVSGSLILLLFMLWTNIRFSHRLYMQRERFTGELCGATQVPVYCVKDLDTPCFLAYLGDKAIYLPKELIGEEDKIRHILIHEDCHARHYDHIWSLVRCALLCYYWINPFVWAAAFLSKRDCELACDAAAVKRLGEEERTSYGRTLIDLTGGRKNSLGFLNASSDLWNGKKAVKERILILVKHPKTTKIMAAAVAVLLLGLILCTYTGQKRETDLSERARQWAEAFCGRNGQELKSMYNAEHSEDFYEMPQVMSQPGDSFIAFGWSSPWPMDSMYEIETKVEQSEITYYARTSDPHIWVWKEWITWKKVKGTWYVDQERSKEYNSVSSAAEFQEAYGDGRLSEPLKYQEDGEGEVLNRKAVNGSVYQELLEPGTALEYLLNLQGGQSSSAEADGDVTAVYTFSDGSRIAVIMVQPFGPGGIWLPEEVAGGAGKDHKAG